MPTYEYICQACDHTFDELQSFSEPPLKKCPVCKKNKLVRAFGTGAAVLFKGSGFYETDYRSDSYKSAAKKDADAATAPADSKAAKADTTDSKTTSTDTKSEGKSSKPKK
jgi:putative FmdB family regulatory protein